MFNWVIVRIFIIDKNEREWSLYTLKNLGIIMKKNKRTVRKDHEEYSMGELAQLARRRMIQRDYGDQKKYTRKSKHKLIGYERFN